MRDLKFSVELTTPNLDVAMDRAVEEAADLFEDWNNSYLIKLDSVEGEVSEDSVVWRYLFKIEKADDDDLEQD